MYIYLWWGLYCVMNSLLIDTEAFLFVFFFPPLSLVLLKWRLPHFVSSCTKARTHGQGGDVTSSEQTPPTD